MNVEVKALYVETVQLLAKAVGNSTPRGYIKSLAKIHDKSEARTLKTVQRILKKARTRFLTKFKADKLKFAKSQESDIKNELRSVMSSAFAGASDELVTALEQHINDIAHNFADAYDVDVNYNLVNDKAVLYLRDTVDNYFTTLSDDQAAGIQSAIADAIGSEEGYTIRDVIDQIRGAFGKDTMYFEDRQLDSTDWALMVARTETARAASSATKATLEDIGAQTWQWQSQGTCCDECDENEDEIVAIGDEFPSGDSEAPAHPNCRCVCIAVVEELTNAEDSTSDE